MYTYRMIAAVSLVFILSGCGAAGSQPQSPATGGAATANANTSAADSSMPSTAMPVTGADASAAAAVASAIVAPPASSDATSAATSKLCSLFTTAEIIDMLGAPVKDGEVAGPMGTACQWSGSTDADAIYAQVQVVNDSNAWSAPSLGDGYEDLKGIGKEAYVIPELGGWAAGALTDKGVLAVAMNGGKASRDSTVKLLRLLMERAK